MDMPHSIDSEKALLCSMIKDPSVLPECADLPREIFYETGHQVLYSALTQLQRDQRPVDWPILVHQLESTGKLDEVGGKDELAHIFEFVPAAENWKFYREILEDRYERRKTILAAQTLITQCQDLSIGYRQSLNEFRHDVECAEIAVPQWNSRLGWQTIKM